MTSRERFEAWRESKYPSNVAHPWNLHTGFQKRLFEAWSARDPEVRELVEALRLVLNEEMSDQKAADEFGGYVLPDEMREKFQSILAKHESDGD